MNLSKNQLKYIKSLHQPKFRQMYENFIGEGDKVVSELLVSKKFQIEMLVATVQWIEQNRPILHEFQNMVYTITNEQMSQISALKTPSEVLIVAKKRLFNINNLLNDNFTAFYLDGVQDPGNVGTIIRIADWFGIDAVIRSQESADFFQPKVVQSSMGSIAGVALVNMDVVQLASLSAIPVYAMDMNGKPLQTMTLPSSCIVVLGSEGQGLSSELKSSLTHLTYITIQGHKDRLAESLNVGVAAGIVAQKIFST
jgi:RNA methyltransferase, TrmH family